MSIRQCSSSNSFRKNLKSFIMCANLPWICMYFAFFMMFILHCKYCKCVLSYFRSLYVYFRQALYHHYCKLIVSSVSSVKYQTWLAFMLFSDTFCPMSYYQFVFLYDCYVILSMFWTINFNFNFNFNFNSEFLENLIKSYIVPDHILMWSSAQWDKENDISICSCQPILNGYGVHYIWMILVFLCLFSPHKHGGGNGKMEVKQNCILLFRLLELIINFICKSLK